MNKRVVGIIAAVVIAIIVIVVAIVGLKGNKDNKIVEDTNKLAQELDPYVTDMTKEEIKDTLNTKYTPEQQEIAEEIFDANHVPEIDTAQKITVSDEGVATYTDTEGRTIEYQLDQDILDMDDEDAEAETAAILAALNDPTLGMGLAPEAENNNTGNTGNENQGNTGDLDNEPDGSSAIGNAGTTGDGDAPVGGYSSDPNSGFQDFTGDDDGSLADEASEGAYSGWIQ